MRDMSYLFGKCTVIFDSAARNNSLYLCAEEGHENALNKAAEKLRSAGLWEIDSQKSVAEDQRQAYINLLSLRDQFELNGVVAVRGDHPKYPSDDEQWQAWKSVLSN